MEKQADIYYYSRTGNCQKVAETLSDNLNASTYQIEDTGIDFGGAIGWLKGGFYAFWQKQTEINVEFGQNNIIYLITPVWAGKIPPGVRSFINSMDWSEKQLYLIATMMGGPGKVFASIEELLTDSNVEVLDRVSISEAELQKREQLLANIVL